MLYNKMMIIIIIEIKEDLDEKKRERIDEPEDHIKEQGNQIRITGTRYNQKIMAIIIIIVMDETMK